MEICVSCGAIAPTSNDQCTRCSSQFEETRKEVAPPSEDLQLVRLHGSFKCRSCGSEVALNHFTLDGYLCGRCGIQQVFSWEEWEQIIIHGHNTADLTGFNQPGIVDEDFWMEFEEQQGDDIARMFRSIGKDKSTLTKGNSFFGGLDFEMDVTPGNPVCDKCKTPFQIARVEGGISLHCATCKTTEVYGKPSDVPYGGLIACIAPEHRPGTKEVQVEAASQGAAVAIHCPNCDGDLNVETLGSVVNCPFCNTSVHVPARLIKQVSGKGVAKKAWWMAFAGKSKWRLDVEKELSIKAERQASKRERIRQEREREAEQALRDAQKRRKLFRTIMIIGAVSTAAVMAAVALWLFLIF